MYYKLFIILFSVVAINAQFDAKLCECDTEEDVKSNQMYWNYLKSLPDDVPKDLEESYSIYPGNLVQFDCSHCEKKPRNKRLTEPDVPEEPKVPDVPEESEEPDVPEEPEKTDKDISDDEYDHTLRFQPKRGDSKCPKNYVKILNYCIHNDDADY